MANLVPADGFNRCLSVHWHRFVLWRVLPMLGAGQEYRLLMQPVLMSPISTGSSNKWFLWPGSLACFLVVMGGLLAWLIMEPNVSRHCSLELVYYFSLFQIILSHRILLNTLV